MGKTLKEFTRRQRNKFERQQLEKQKQLKKGRFTKTKAQAMSHAAGRDMNYMIERNDIKIEKRRIRL